jgi:hypothetical protein
MVKMIRSILYCSKSELYGVLDDFDFDEFVNQGTRKMAVPRH